MSARKVGVLSAIAIGIGVGAAIMAADADKQDFTLGISYGLQKSQFDQAMEHASDRARGDPQAMEKAALEGDRARDEAGVSHTGELGKDGSLSPDKGPSAGASISKDGAEVHVKIDTDKSPPPASPPVDHGGAGDGSDHGSGDFHDGGYAGPDHGDYGNTV